MKLSEAAILIVDDEPALVEIFEVWVSNAGSKNVYTAQNGEAALAILNARTIHLLISDVRMPVMDGITLVRHLAQTGETLPSIIFVSGFGTIDLREMYGIGVEAFFSKPMDRSELIAAVERALEERDVLWLTPMESSLKQSITLGCPHDSQGCESLHLGRGGFSASCDESVHLGRVAFQSNCSDEKCAIAGEGFIRWHDKESGRLGIEIQFLDAGCRPRIMLEINSKHPLSFIPSM